MIKTLKRKRIAIDIDDVLSETMNNFIKFLKSEHNIIINYDEVINFNLHELRHFKEKGINLEKTHELWNWFSNSNFGKEMWTIEWSIDWVDRLKTAWFELILITARWWSLMENTKTRIASKFPQTVFNDIHFTWKFAWTWTSKSDICKMYDIELMIEDNAHTCLDLANKWIKSYLIERPWNKHIKTSNPLIKRISWWHEIEII